jgi:hypothetical protein
MTTGDKIQGTRSASTTNEQVIFAGRCRLFGIKPELTTTGTITIRDGSAADASGATKHVAAIGLLQPGKNFNGVVMLKGITVQQSVASDQMLVEYEPF